MASFKKLKEFNESRDKYSWDDTGITISGQDISEKMVFDRVFDKISKINTPDRTIQLPGLTQARGLIEGAAKKFARDEVEARFEFQPLADVDDAVMQPIRPETFGLDTFQQTGVASGGTINVVPQGSSGDYSLNEDEWIIITDVIDTSDDDIASAIQFLDVDGNERNPEEMGPQMFAADSLKVYPLNSPEVIQTRMNMDAKPEFAGDTQLRPAGVHLAEGSRTGTL